MKTILHDRHLALGAKMVDFSGWEMPVQYQGIIQEHQSVRKGVGIFDVSHMGRIEIKGKDAEKLLDFLSTNSMVGKTDGSATYTVWCDESGGCVDDLIVYRETSEKFFVVVNAGNRQKDLQHLLQNSTSYDVKIKDRYSEEGIIAIQGPKAKQTVLKRFPQAEQLKPMHFIREGETIISSTGYTGAGGFEIYAPLFEIVKLWDYFIGAGVVPIGLGARDTLRLEMGFALYGHELTDSIFPNETVSRWTIKWDKEFLGKRAIERVEHSSDRRSMYGVILKEKGIAREGYEVYLEDKKIGNVTSGTLSPSLNQSVAIILVEKDLSAGDTVEVQIRKNRVKAEVVKLPFLRSYK